MTLIGTIKNVLKRILPPPVKSFMREVERILSAIQKQGQKQNIVLTEIKETKQQVADVLAEIQCAQQGVAGVLQEVQRGKQCCANALVAVQENKFQVSILKETLFQRLDELSEETNALQELVRFQVEELRLLRKQLEMRDNAAAEVAKKESSDHNMLLEKVERMRLLAAEGSRNASEAVWAETFNNAISGSRWLKDTAFSPGRWAVGYPYLYVMYRVLNEARPKRVLELGLGQSTRMIAQYAAAHEDVEHIVVEHDPEWISFFENDFCLSPRSRIVQLEREMTPYKEAEAVRVFKGFSDAFIGEKFDFISIDAPLGGDMKQYARIDVLQLMPECLSENFVVMIDDCERSGEVHTVQEMENKLRSYGIPYKRGRYAGKKDCVLLSAEHMGFLTSM